MCTGGCGDNYHKDYPGVVRNANKDTLKTVPAQN